ncbi:MAG: hypothetical protein J1G06_10475 [Oscillospiraceae bacterium]|nr:hypothetical protein [Oscillospiraceae bacterium]
MKKSKVITVILASMLSLSALTANAAEIPRESMPASATLEAVQIVEDMIGDILDEVENGLGYGLAASSANTRIREAVNADKTCGYGYGILSPIAKNAIRTMRDMQLRPEVYQQAEEELKVLLADLISEVENGMDYDEAVKQAYILIYQSVNPSFNPDEQFALDICYQDIPAVDMAKFTVARRLLLDAQTVQLQTVQSQEE